MEARNPAIAFSHRPAFPISFPEGAIFRRIANSRTAGSYYNHEGGTGGFSTSILLFPDKKMAVVVMMNVGEQDPGQLAYEIVLRILNSKPK